MTLKETAKDLVKTADRLKVLCEKYVNDALAEARETGRDNTDGGMSARQLKSRVQAEVIARLCPKPVFGLPDPVLQFNGAPEARKFVAVRGPLPGLQT